MILWANSRPPDPPSVPGQWLPGIDYWLEARLRSAAEPSVWMQIIDLALDLGQLDAAERWLSESEKNQAQDGNAELHLRGRLYELQGTCGQAEDLFRQSLEHRPVCPRS